MENSCTGLSHVPDEIIILILQKLFNTEVLYSVIGITVWLDQIACDPIFTRDLSFMRRTSNGCIYPMTKEVVNRFCTDILPKINHNVKWLNLEPVFMKSILSAADYPNLHELGLMNVRRDTIVNLNLESNLKDHIDTLVIMFASHKTEASGTILKDTVWNRVLDEFPKLLCLKFEPSSEVDVRDFERSTFCGENPPTFYSSTLMELHINLEHFSDCLYLLDGRFDQLRIFYVHVHWFTPPLAIENKKPLDNLKCFSLTCEIETVVYDDILVPCLNRMLNLEELLLNIIVFRSTFIDGDTLKNNIVSHMPHLLKFVFSIHSIVNGLTQSPLSKDMHDTFASLVDYQVTSYMDNFEIEGFSQCHIYSQPYTMNYLRTLSNNFPGGLFKFVNKVSLFDERPFEYEFFFRISQAFPYLKILTVWNSFSQNHSKCAQSNDDSRKLPVIEYSNLKQLFLWTAHDSYLEQFLDITKTYLSNYIYVCVTYHSLHKVTQNFTRDLTRNNCSKIKYLINFDLSNVPEHFYEYFPNLEKKLE